MGKPIITITVEETDVVTEIGTEEIEAGGETMTETEGEAEVVIDGEVETVIVVIAIEGIGTVIEIGIGIESVTGKETGIEIRREKRRLRKKKGLGVEVKKDPGAPNIKRVKKTGRNEVIKMTRRGIETEKTEKLRPK